MKHYTRFSLLLRAVSTKTSRGFVVTFASLALVLTMAISSTSLPKADAKQSSEAPTSATSESSSTEQSDPNLGGLSTSDDENASDPDETSAPDEEQNSDETSTSDEDQDDKTDLDEDEDETSDFAFINPLSVTVNGTFMADRLSDSDVAIYLDNTPKRGTLYYYILPSASQAPTAQQIITAVGSNTSGTGSAAIDATNSNFGALVTNLPAGSLTAYATIVDPNSLLDNPLLQETVPNTLTKTDITVTKKADMSPTIRVIYDTPNVWHIDGGTVGTSGFTAGSDPDIATKRHWFNVNSDRSKADSLQFIGNNTADSFGVSISNSFAEGKSIRVDLPTSVSTANAPVLLKFKNYYSRNNTSGADVWPLAFFVEEETYPATQKIGDVTIEGSVGFYAYNTKYSAAISVAKGADVTIRGTTAKTSDYGTYGSTDILTAQTTNNNGAGIGAPLNIEGGIVRFDTVTVTATSAGNAAGIGSSISRSMQSVYINKSDITGVASGGAGIGGGNTSHTELVDIKDSLIDARCTGYQGPGIGGAYRSSGGTINILGNSKVFAQGAGRTAAIGSGFDGSQGTVNYVRITIDGTGATQRPVVIAHNKTQVTYNATIGGGETGYANSFIDIKNALVVVPTPGNYSDNDPYAIGRITSAATDNPVSIAGNSVVFAQSIAPDFKHFPIQTPFNQREKDGSTALYPAYIPAKLKNAESTKGLKVKIDGYTDTAGFPADGYIQLPTGDNATKSSELGFVNDKFPGAIPLDQISGAIYIPSSSGAFIPNSKFHFKKEGGQDVSIPSDLTYRSDDAIPWHNDGHNWIASPNNFTLKANDTNGDTTGVTVEFTGSGSSELSLKPTDIKQTVSKLTVPIIDSTHDNGTNGKKWNVNFDPASVVGSPNDYTLAFQSSVLPTPFLPTLSNGVSAIYGTSTPSSVTLIAKPIQITNLETLRTSAITGSASFNVSSIGQYRWKVIPATQQADQCGDETKMLVNSSMAEITTDNVKNGIKLSASTLSSGQAGVFCVMARRDADSLWGAIQTSPIAATPTDLEIVLSDEDITDNLNITFSKDGEFKITGLKPDGRPYPYSTSGNKSAYDLFENNLYSSLITSVTFENIGTPVTPSATPAVMVTTVGKIVQSNYLNITYRNTYIKTKRPFSVMGDAKAKVAIEGTVSQEGVDSPAFTIANIPNEGYNPPRVPFLILTSKITPQNPTPVLNATTSGASGWCTVVGGCQYEGPGEIIFEGDLKTNLVSSGNSSIVVIGDPGLQYTTVRPIIFRGNSDITCTVTYNATCTGGLDSSGSTMVFTENSKFTAKTAGTRPAMSFTQNTTISGNAKIYAESTGANVAAIKSDKALTITDNAKVYAKAAGGTAAAVICGTSFDITPGSAGDFIGKRPTLVALNGSSTSSPAGAGIGGEAATRINIAGGVVIARAGNGAGGPDIGGANGAANALAISPQAIVYAANGKVWATNATASPMNQPDIAGSFPVYPVFIPNKIAGGSSSLEGKNVVLPGVTTGTNMINSGERAFVNEAISLFGENNGLDDLANLSGAFYGKAGSTVKNGITVDGGNVPAGTQVTVDPISPLKSIDGYNHLGVMISATATPVNGVSKTQTTTQIKIVFDRKVDNLAKEQIVFSDPSGDGYSAKVTSVEQNLVLDSSGKTYLVNLDPTTVSEEIAHFQIGTPTSIAKEGYIFQQDPSQNTVQLFAVGFHLADDGTARVSPTEAFKKFRSISQRGSSTYYYMYGSSSSAPTAIQIVTAANDINNASAGSGDLGLFNQGFDSNLPETASKLWMTASANATPTEYTPVLTISLPQKSPEDIVIAQDDLNCTDITTVFADCVVIVYDTHTIFHFERGLKDTGRTEGIYGKYFSTRTDKVIFEGAFTETKTNLTTMIRVINGPNVDTISTIPIRIFWHNTTFSTRIPLLLSTPVTTGTSPGGPVAVDLVLRGRNETKSIRTGIIVPVDSKLTIRDDAENNDYLQDELVVNKPTQNLDPGIGGADSATVIYNGDTIRSSGNPSNIIGNIVITGSAKVTSEGTQYTAAIGGTRYSDLQSIRIEGHAIVDAVNNNTDVTCSAIGAGADSKGGSITITDSAKVKAVATCRSGAAIGTGVHSGGNAIGSSLKINITAGQNGERPVVYAQDTANYSVGIGAGLLSVPANNFFQDGYVNITGGVVFAKGATATADIGGGIVGNNRNLPVSIGGNAIVNPINGSDKVGVSFTAINDSGPTRSPVSEPGGSTSVYPIFVPNVVVSSQKVGSIKLKGKKVSIASAINANMPTDAELNTISGFGYFAKVDPLAIVWVPIDSAKLVQGVTVDNETFNDIKTNFTKTYPTTAQMSDKSINWIQSPTSPPPEIENIQAYNVTSSYIYAHFEADTIGKYQYKIVPKANEATQCDTSAHLLADAPTGFTGSGTIAVEQLENGVDGLWDNTKFNGQPTVFCAMGRFDENSPWGIITKADVAANMADEIVLTSADVLAQVNINHVSPGIFKINGLNPAGRVYKDGKTAYQLFANRYLGIKDTKITFNAFGTQTIPSTLKVIVDGLAFASEDYLDITYRNMFINSTDPINVRGDAKVALNFEGISELKGSNAAIGINSGSSTGTIATVLLRGKKTVANPSKPILTVSSTNDAAAIGARVGETGGNVIIDGDLIINDNTTGNGANIGGANARAFGSIEVKGNVEINATKTNIGQGTGIGAGNDSLYGSISISGNAVVKVESGSEAAAIGGAYGQPAGPISISENATVYASNNNTTITWGAQTSTIGGGAAAGNIPSITISDNTRVYAKGYSGNAADIESPAIGAHGTSSIYIKPGEGDFAGTRPVVFATVGVGSTKTTKAPAIGGNASRAANSTLSITGGVVVTQSAKGASAPDIGQVGKGETPLIIDPEAVVYSLNSKIYAANATQAPKNSQGQPVYPVFTPNKLPGGVDSMVNKNLVIPGVTTGTKTIDATERAFLDDAITKLNSDGNFDLLTDTSASFFSTESKGEVITNGITINNTPAPSGAQLTVEPVNNLIYSAGRNWLGVVRYPTITALNGTANTQTTTQIKVVFDRPVEGFDKDSITITDSLNDERGVTIQDVTKDSSDSTNKTYIVKLDPITVLEGQATVSFAPLANEFKEGYISPQGPFGAKVQLHAATPILTGGTSKGSFGGGAVVSNFKSNVARGQYYFLYGSGQTTPTAAQIVAAALDQSNAYANASVLGLDNQRVDNNIPSEYNKLWIVGASAIQNPTAFSPVMTISYGLKTPETINITQENIDCELTTFGNCVVIIYDSPTVFHIDEGIKDSGSTAGVLGKSYSTVTDKVVFSGVFTETKANTATMIRVINGPDITTVSPHPLNIVWNNATFNCRLALILSKPAINAASPGGPVAVNLIARGTNITNTIRTAIMVPRDSKITIRDDAEDNSSAQDEILVTRPTQNYDPGIGGADSAGILYTGDSARSNGNPSYTIGNIVISGSVKVKSEGRTFSAAIGGPRYSSLQSIRIEDHAIVDAVNNDTDVTCAAIGSGADSKGGNITITDAAQVKAVAKCRYSVAIGTAVHSNTNAHGSSLKLNITEGQNGERPVVFAQNTSDYSVGIGAGVRSVPANNYFQDGYVNITGGVIFAQGAPNTADIGGGVAGTNRNLPVSIGGNAIVNPVNGSNKVGVTFTGTNAAGPEQSLVSEIGGSIKAYPIFAPKQVDSFSLSGKQVSIPGIASAKLPSAAELGIIDDFGGGSLPDDLAGIMWGSVESEILMNGLFVDGSYAGLSVDVKKQYPTKAQSSESHINWLSSYRSDLPGNRFIFKLRAPIGPQIVGQPIHYAFEIWDTKETPEIDDDELIGDASKDPNAHFEVTSLNRAAQDFYSWNENALTIKKVGAYTVSAQYGDDPKQSVELDVAFNKALISSVELTSPATSVVYGRSVQLSAAASDEFGNRIDVTKAVDYSTQAGRIDENAVFTAGYLDQNQQIEATYTKDDDTAIHGFLAVNVTSLPANEITGTCSNPHYQIKADCQAAGEIWTEASNPDPGPDPTPTDPTPTDPTPTDPSPTDPTPTDPAPTDPTPTDPTPTDPTPTDPTPTDPTPTDPTPTDPTPTDPTPTDPTPTDPTPTDPTPTDPSPTDPTPTDPTPTPSPTTTSPTPNPTSSPTSSTTTPTSTPTNSTSGQPSSSSTDGSNATSSSDSNSNSSNGSKDSNGSNAANGGTTDDDAAAAAAADEKANKAIAGTGVAVSVILTIYAITMVGVLSLRRRSRRMR